MGLSALISSMDNQKANTHDILRVGKITSCNPGRATARVVFEDQDDKESYDLYIIVDNSKENKKQHSYDVGEHVLCAFLPSGTEAGFIIGAYYPDGEVKPTSSHDVEVKEFSDGTRIEYDRSQSLLSIDCVNAIDIKTASETSITCESGIVSASSLLFDCPDSIFTGNVAILGNAEISGALDSGGGGGGGATISGGVSISGGSVTHNGTNIGDSHTHGGVEAGGDSSGGPE